jgi:chromosome segregation protein
MMNFAEATIFFENGDRRLAVDSSEVRVTRRVYRSGEGEYLINGQACRLKDIRDLFRGTGVGTDAYSLIEQGKVDRMLDASPKERRAIFEEAAGISRFKAKKLETQRRLDRVAQNLLRLSDIVEEVESRLRTVRGQATKARQYREWQQRLKELRTQVGLTDWLRLTEQWDSASEELQTIRGEESQLNAQLQQLESELRESEQETSNLADQISQSETKAGRHRESIAASHSRRDQQRTQLEDLERQRRRVRRQYVLFRDRAGDVDDKLSSLVAEIETEQQAVNDSRKTVLRLTSESSGWDQAAARHRAAMSQWQPLHTQLLPLQSHWEQKASQLRDEAATTLGRQQQAIAAASELRHTQEQFRCERTEVSEIIENALVDIKQNQTQLDAHLRVQEEDTRLLRRREDELSALQNRLAGLRERTDLLAQLEQRREGVGAGPQEVLQRATRASAGPYADVLGLVGDCFEVELEFAPLVDVVLGQHATAIVLKPNTNVEAWCQLRSSLPGRITLMPLSDLSVSIIDLPLHFHEFADRPVSLASVVQVPAELEPLRDHLLANTLIVPDLNTAFAWRKNGITHPLVTRAGEQLAPDGSLSLGPSNTSSNIVSRRSELRVLQRGVLTVENQISMADSEIARMTNRVAGHQEQVRQFQNQLEQRKEQLADQRVALLTLDDRLQRIDKQLESEQVSVTSLAHQSHRFSRDAHRADELSRNIQRQLDWIAANENAEREMWEQSERSARAIQTQLRDAEIDAARREQWLHSLEHQQGSFESDRQERTRAVDETKDLLQQVAVRFGQVENQVLSATAEIAQHFWQLEQVTTSVVNLHQVRRQWQQRQREANQTLQIQRRVARTIEQQVHQREMEVQQWEREREQLLDRFRDDFQIDLKALAKEAEDGMETAHDKVEEEIAQLRKKLSGIGAVNMEALEELDSLEERFTSLSGQYQDLVHAKEALERIIHKINADSRRLFVETLEAIRENFVALYRRSFGGGHAELVLEEGVDVLEAGIDIVATPPGKPSFNNSLLSGGERALTAVSLLLGIFQYRPSPFCVLDEVDAPFDEANIGRFISVLRDFLDSTRFVIVTHSKKTMTAADTLYGVTMQESGVSKRVSVRFEDVHSDGEISQEVLDREAAGEDPEDEQAA